MSLPQGWDEITPDWMTAALSRHHPGAVVDGVSVVLRDDGTNKRARLALTYSAGSGPATVFAKAVDPDHAELVALTSGLYHEPRLFTSGVELPLDHPTVYTALIDEDRSDFLMIMEDVVASGADPRDSTRPMSIDQVASGVRGLARMHSRFWGERLDTYPTLDWLEPFVAFEGMQYAPLHIAHERLGETVAPEVLALGGTDLFVDIWARYIGTLTPFHPDVAARRPAHRQHLRAAGRRGRVPGLADGPARQLVAWTSATSCRARSPSRTADVGERDLLAEYRGALDLPADELPSADEVWLRYRASVAHGLAIWMATLSGGDAWQGADICLALAQRYAAAFVDLETRTALDAISA